MGRIKINVKIKDKIIISILFLLVINQDLFFVAGYFFVLTENIFSNFLLSNDFRQFIHAKFQ